MAKRKVTYLQRTEQPMNWWRAFLCGMLGAVLLMSIINIFAAMQVTSFSLELYIGSLVAQTPYPHRIWMAGFLVNALLGGIFGFMYAYFFEYVFKEANARRGVWVGLIHAVVAAVAFFPFFQVVHEFYGTGVYRGFGFFGSGLGGQTALILLFGHLAFGASVGLFYGPVRSGRVRARFFEPGTVAAPLSDPEAIRPEDDAEDRVAV